MGDTIDQCTGITGLRAAFNDAARRVLYSPSVWYVTAAALAGVGGTLAARPDGGLTGWLIGSAIALSTAAVLSWRRRVRREGIEHRLRDAIDAIGDGFMLFDHEDRLVLANRQVRELYAPIADRLVPGTPFVDILHAAVFEQSLWADGMPGTPDEIFARRLAAHRAGTGQADIYRTRTGHWIRVREYAMPGGARVGLRTDVTELKERERAIAENEARLRSLYDNTPAMMHALDAEGRIISVSDHWLRKMGYAREEVLGRPPTDFMTEDSRAEVERTGGAKGLVEQGPVQDRPRSYLNKNGERIDALVSGFVERDSEGRFVRGVTVLTDVTELRTREAELTALSEELAEKNRILDAALEHMSHGLAMFDDEQRLTICNERYTRMFDRPPHLCAPGAHLVDMIRHDGHVLGWTEEEIERRIEERLELSRMRRDGTVVVDAVGGRTMKVFHSPLAGGGSLAIYEDVTAMEAHKRALREAKESAEIANRAKSEFLANMSHELRTPLNAIIGFSEILKSELFGAIGVEKYRDYARDIHESGTHLLSLIGDILDVSKVEAGKVELDEAELPVEHIARASLRLVQPRAAEAQVEVEAEFGHGDARLRGDERMVKQMLLNLLSNAVKFTPEGGTVTLYTRVGEDGGFVLGVRDTGIGIAAEDIPRVLAPFGQVASAFTRRHAGTGLGLPLVKSFAEAHGGELELASAPGEGTDAAVAFPAERTVVALPEVQAVGA